MSRSIVSCSVCGQKSSVFGGGQWYCPACNTMHPSVERSQFQSEQPGEAQEMPRQPGPPARPRVWEDVQKRVQEQGAGEPMAVEGEEPEDDSRQATLKRTIGIIQEEMGSIVARVGTQDAAARVPRYQTLAGQLGDAQEELRSILAAEAEKAAESVPPTEPPAVPEPPTEEEVAESEAAAAETPPSPLVVKLVLDISDIVPDGDTGFYECSECRNRIGAIAGHQMPPCGRCDKPGIGWRKVADADEGEELAEVGSIPPPEEAPAPADEGTFSVRDIAEDAGVFIKDVAAAAKVLGISDARQGSDTVNNAERGQLLAALRGAEGGSPEG